MKEADLLREIEKLNEKIKTNELFVRNLNEKDWDTLVSWWKWWRHAIMPKEFLPENGTGGIMVEKDNIPIVAGFFYQTNSTLVIFDWVVSNPKYRDSDRGEAIELLIKESEKTCKKLGYRHIFSWARNKKLVDTHRKLGWNVDKKPSNELIKNL